VDHDVRPSNYEIIRIVLRRHEILIIIYKIGGASRNSVMGKKNFIGFSHPSEFSQICLVAGNNFMTVRRNRSPKNHQSVIHLVQNFQDLTDVDLTLS
jgi:hypothetical protein